MVLSLERVEEWLRRELERKTYPMYHCRECGHFFKDEAGGRREGLRGQQEDVIAITCKACEEGK